MFRANYWMSLFFNGIVLGIWPAAVLAMILSQYPIGTGTADTFVKVFVFALVSFALIIMWLYDNVIWRRRRAKSRQINR